MCGFIGYMVQPNTKHADYANKIFPHQKRALSVEKIRLRGTDDSSQWSDHKVWMGHCRLSIVDLSENGRQPMTHHEYTIVYNGMIYNFKKIRKQLEILGCKFKTKTDTEVIVAGWATWGKGLVSKLEGFFAFAIWDQKSNELSLVRDRLGKKPLFYRLWNDSIVFGSRLDAIECLTEQTKLSDQARSWLLTLKYIPDPMSVNPDIKKVPPGHCLSIKNSDFNLVKWYDADNGVESVPRSYDEYKTKLKNLINQAVEKRLISDVPVSCFLSGGIDSAIVASIATRYRSIDTFTAGFQESAFDESDLARETASHLGTNHHEVRISSFEQLEMVDRLFMDALDEPFGDSSALPSLFVSNAIKRHATVALSGDGADELFGGYKKYQGELLVDYWNKLPTPLISILKNVLKNLPQSHNNRITDKIRQLNRLAHAAEFDDVNRHASWMEFASSAEDIQLLFTESRHKELVQILQGIGKNNNLDRLSLTLLRDIKTVLISDMLVKVDRTSMNSNIEVRSPFLDHRVLELSLQIPGEHKISWGKGKKILRDVFQGDLPAKILNGQKKGFELPLNAWLTGPLETSFRRVLSPDFLSYNGLNHQFSEVLERGVYKGSLPHAEFSWTLMSIYAWQEKRGFS